MPKSTNTPFHDEVERLAYKLWRERGSPVGTPETDWFRAEKELKSTDGSEEPLLLAAAKTIGSALGSLSAILNTPTEDE